MKVIYVTEQGSVVRKTSRRLIITKEKKKLAEVSCIGLGSLVIFGNVQITTQTMTFLLENGTSIILLSQQGKYRGTVMPAQSKNVLLRIAQYERYLDEDFQRELAAAFVAAKIQNGITLIRRYEKYYPDLSFHKTLHQLQDALNKISEKPVLPSLLGIEGAATAAYFSAFGEMLRRNMPFTIRTRRPPRDPVNALLSFGYSLITNELFSLLIAVGFDPYIGFLHELDYGRPSLALDIVEEFRHSVIDRFTIFLINNRVLSPDDFEENAEGGIFLNHEALKRYFLHYDKRMNEEFSDPVSGESICYRKIFRKQVYRLAKTIQTLAPYDPYRLA
jgi:CRISPR-associated protein Cas1